MNSQSCAAGLSGKRRISYISQSCAAGFQEKGVLFIPGWASCQKPAAEAWGQRPGARRHQAARGVGQDAECRRCRSECFPFQRRPLHAQPRQSWKPNYPTKRFSGLGEIAPSVSEYHHCTYTHGSSCAGAAWERWSCLVIMLFHIFFVMAT